MYGSQWPIEQPTGWFDLNRESDQATGLISWWPALASPIGPLRDLVTGYSASLTGNAYVGPDPEFGLALQCDGNGDYADAGQPPVLVNLLTEFTISAWVRFTGSFVNYCSPVAMGTAVANQLGIIVLNTGVWYGQMGDGGGVLGGTLALDRWYHLAYTCTGGPISATVRSYQDGLLQNTSTLSNFTRTSNFTIGGDAVNSRWHLGAIADARVHQVALPGTVLYQAWAPETRWDLYDIDWDLLALYPEFAARLPWHLLHSGYTLGN